METPHWGGPHLGLDKNLFVNGSLWGWWMAPLIMRVWGAFKPTDFLAPPPHHLLVDLVGEEYFCHICEGISGPVGGNYECSEVALGPQASTTTATASSPHPCLLLGDLSCLLGTSTYASGYNGSKLTISSLKKKPLLQLLCIGNALSFWLLTFW